MWFLYIVCHLFSAFSWFHRIICETLAEIYLHPDIYESNSLFSLSLTETNTADNVASDQEGLLETLSCATIMCNTRLSLWLCLYRNEHTHLQNVYRLQSVTMNTSSHHDALCEVFVSIHAHHLVLRDISTHTNNTHTGNSRVLSRCCSQA